MRINTICCVGANHVGGPACCIIAYKCPQIRVFLLDKEEIISLWNSDPLPFCETELCGILKKCRNRNLFFSSDFSRCIKESDLIFISMNYPAKTQGLGQDRVINLNQLEDAARLIALHAESDKIVVEKSSVPVRAAEKMSLILRANCQPGVRFHILSNPEFITEGSIVQDLLNPDRVVIGCQNNPTGRGAAESLYGVYEHWIPRKNVIIFSTASSEVLKLTTNAFLAQKMCSINSIFEICEETNTNFKELSEILKKDSRLGSKYLDGCLGFGGFQKEILCLIYICESLKLSEVADYWYAVLEMNNYQKKKYLDKIKSITGPVRDKCYAIWGFAIQKNTCATKNSPALEVCKWLLNEGADIRIYDPKVASNQIKKDLNLEKINERKTRAVICKDCYSACKQTSAIILCMDWDEFTKVDFIKALELMVLPVMIDTMNFLVPEALEKSGFEYHKIGIS